jgi:hypothetical protein
MMNAACIDKVFDNVFTLQDCNMPIMDGWQVPQIRHNIFFLNHFEMQHVLKNYLWIIRQQRIFARGKGSTIIRL